MTLSYILIAVLVLIVSVMVYRTWQGVRARQKKVMDDVTSLKHNGNIVKDNSLGYSQWHPDVIPINREEDYHTHYIGHTSDGMQFFAYDTFYYEPSEHGIPEDWEQHRKEYVVLYLFDSKGNYLQTKHWYAGTTAEMNEKAIANKMQEMLLELGETSFGNISVKPFATVIDGITFGLIPNEELETIDLEPSSTISFSAPWDGEYYT